MRCLIKVIVFRQGVEASAHEPVRKLWTTEGELASSR